MTINAKKNAIGTFAYNLLILQNVSISWDHPQGVYIKQAHKNTDEL